MSPPTKVGTLARKQVASLLHLPLLHPYQLLESPGSRTLSFYGLALLCHG